MRGRRLVWLTALMTVGVLGSTMTAAQAAGGSVDRSFGENGRVIGPQLPNNDIAVQADGKIVTGGGRFAFRLNRWNPDGTRDTTFGSRGAVKTTFDGCSASVLRLAIQADQRIVAFGNCGWTRFAIARYLPDGELDTSFAHDGTMTAAAHRRDGTSEGVWAIDAAIQSDGKIVAVGLGPGPGFTVVRYLSNGRLDTTFSGDGQLITSVTTYDGPSSVAVQPDGRIVVAGLSNWWVDSGSGTCGCGEGERTGWFVVRYMPHGRLDTSFGGDGKVLTRFSPRMEWSDSMSGMALQGDGRIVLAGTIGDTWAVIRYTLHGALDRTFGSDGISVLSATSASSFHHYVQGWPNAVVIQADGKIVVGGYLDIWDSDSEVVRWTLARVTANGEADPGFGRNGLVKTAVETSDPSGMVNALALQSDGKILAAGSCADGGAIVRYVPS